MEMTLVSISDKIGYILSNFIVVSIDISEDVYIEKKK